MRNIFRDKATYWISAAVGVGLLLDSIKFRVAPDIINTEGIIINMEGKCKDTGILFGNDKPDVDAQGDGTARARLRLFRYPGLKDFFGTPSVEKAFKVDLRECERPEGDGNPARRR